MSLYYKKLHFSPPPISLSIEVDLKLKPPSDFRSQISQPWPRRARKRFLSSSLLFFYYLIQFINMCGSLGSLWSSLVCLFIINLRRGFCICVWLCFFVFVWIKYKRVYNFVETMRSNQILF